MHEAAKNPNKGDLMEQIVRNNSRERSSESNEKEICCGRKRSLTTSLQLRYAPRNRAFTLRRPRSPLPLFGVLLRFLSWTIERRFQGKAARQDVIIQWICRTYCLTKSKSNSFSMGKYSLFIFDGKVFSQ